MLVSLSVKNFKSIREAHVRFGPFTCFVGHNGVGKSNLFDAIHFLSALTDRDISEAVSDVRRSVRPRPTSRPREATYRPRSMRSWGEILEPEFRKRIGSVADFLTTYETGAMLIFVHRDSENLGLDERRREFETLDRQDFVPVVPVRMSESWILFNHTASRQRGRIHHRLQSARESAGVPEFPGSARRALPVPDPA